jgi:hypothetical protein
MRGASFRAPGPGPGMRLVSYGGAVVALAGATRYYLAPQVAARDAGDPLVAFAALMCAYAEGVRSRRLAGPYTDERAEMFARAVLIDDDEFRHLDANGYDDLLLAGHFQVPTEQIPAKRCDLR